MIDLASPLAHRIRPTGPEELIGQKAAISLIEDFKKGKVGSVLLWGPPGSGKTSVANIIRRLHPDQYYEISAVTSGIQEIRKITGAPHLHPPLVFVDEIHRFTRVQQDALLPHVENGTIILIGATTENPSFTIASPLLSRLRIIKLEALSPDALKKILYKALTTDREIISTGKTLDDECVKAIANACSGDARSALNLLEFILTKIDKETISPADLEGLLDRPLYHDKSGDTHYDLISAFQKSIRASEVDASVYWLGRMLNAGEDRLYILRRLIRIASEDIGMAEPHALGIALDARDAFTALGSPEGDLAIYQATVYLACAPKSNALEVTEHAIRRVISATGTPPVPLALRNAPTRLMKNLGYGKDYKYAHDDPEGALRMEYLPEGVPSQPLYVPKNTGFEKRLKEIINARRAAKKSRTAPYSKAPAK